MNCNRSNVRLATMLKAIPNILTLGRLALSMVFLGMILYSPRTANKTIFLDISLVVFIVAGLTDIIDGMAARSLKATSKFGRMLDPLVDKILVCGAFVCFAIIRQPQLFNWSTTALATVQWSVAGVLILRETYVTIIRHVAESRGVNFAATASGKIKMMLQSFAIGTVLIKMAHVPTTAQWGHWFTAVTFAAMLAVTVASGLFATRRTAFKQTTAKPSAPQPGT